MGFPKRKHEVMVVILAVSCLLVIVFMCVANYKMVEPRTAHVHNSDLLDSVPLVNCVISNTPNFSYGKVVLGTYTGISVFQNLTLQKLKQRQPEIFKSRNFPSNVAENNTGTVPITADKYNSHNNTSQSIPVVFPKTTTMTFNQTLVVHCKESPYIECDGPTVKPIPGRLFTIAYFRRPEWNPRQNFNSTTCKVNQCLIDEDTVTNETDIVVVYGVGLNDNYAVPQRWPHQIYALHLTESPVYTQSDFLTNWKSPWNDQINLLMSYLVDSAMFYPYNKLKFQPKPLAQRPDYYAIAKNKTRTAVWIVSHCETSSLREKYVKEMQKYIDVDIFGKCGKPCSQATSTCNDWASKYKFHLSFENSLCPDYVTEKFFKLFDQHVYVIPVVRGGADYDKYFPEFTYINTSHFKSPKDLALHLKDLASDLQTYSKYLEYKDVYRIVPYDSLACKLCAFLHSHKLPDKSQTFVLRSKFAREHCRIPSDF